MDAYLESLVRKEKLVEGSDSTKPVVEQTNLSDEPLLETENKTDSTEREAEIEVAADLAEGTDEVEVATGLADQQNNHPDQQSDTQDVNAAVDRSEKAHEYVQNGTYKVDHIRVFKSPDVNQISRMVSGNVTFLGKIGDFNIIGYMKHGFGIVRGYTLNDLE